MRARVYYNEIDKFCCQWLKNLMAAGLIPAGDVDDRSIKDVTPDDLKGYDSAHFFSGFGGWPFALRQAGWPDDRPIWSGSCPCGPFSVAGKQEGFDDPRHLWPFWKPLIAERRPTVVIGEQVAAASRWLALVRGDLEEMGYAVGAISMEAASANADHFRDRYWFVADRDNAKWRAIEPGRNDAGGTASGWDQGYSDASERGQAGYDIRAMAHHDQQQPSIDNLQRGGQFGGPSCHPQDTNGTLADDDGERAQEPVRQSGDAGAKRATFAGGDFRVVEHDPSVGWGEGWTEHEFRRRGFTAAVASFDDQHQYVECPDSKWRRLPPPRVRWLGNGLPARVHKLRAIGNAIDQRPAIQFIKAYLESE